MSAQNKKNVSDKLSELSQLVAWFQSADFNLEAALDKYQAAEKLAEEIEQDLTKLKNDIQVVAQRFDEGAE